MPGGDFILHTRRSRSMFSIVWHSQTLYQTLYRVEKGSGDMAVPKLFYFPNSGSGQLKYLRSRVRPCNWMQGSSMDDMRFHCFSCVATGLGEAEGVAIEGYYCICSQSGCFGVLPTGYGKSLCYACQLLLFDHLYQLEDSQRSIVLL